MSYPKIHQPVCSVHTSCAPVNLFANKKCKLGPEKVLHVLNVGICEMRSRKRNFSIIEDPVCKKREGHSSTSVCVCVVLIN